MIAVGLWGAQLGAPAVWLLPVTFPMVMAFGGMLGLMGVALPGIEVGIAVSAIALGFAVFREARPSLWIAALVVGVFAIFHGNAHGTELPPGANGDPVQHRLRDRDGHAARDRHRDGRSRIAGRRGAWRCAPRARPSPWRAWRSCGRRSPGAAHDVAPTSADAGARRWRSARGVAPRTRTS